MPQLRDIGLWDEEYLCNLPPGEFDWVDFKGSRWLEDEWLDEASQYLSAFANFDGGYLIIGVHDPERNGSIRPDGGVNRSFKNGIKSWLEDKLPVLVEARLDRIGVQEILPSGPESKINNDHCVLVICVAPSSAAPHQARNHKYYTRLGSKLSPLGHRAVMDIINRPRHPIVETTISLVIGRRKSHLCWHVENKSPVMARFVASKLRFPVIIGRQFTKLQDVAELTNNSEQAFWWTVDFHNDPGRPLFPGSVSNQRFEFELAPFGQVPELIAANSSKHPRSVSFETYADNMPPVSDTLAIEKITTFVNDL